MKGMKLANIVTLNLWIRPMVLSNILDCVSMTNDLRMAFLSFWRPHRASAVQPKDRKPEFDHGR